MSDNNLYSFDLKVNEKQSDMSLSNISFTLIDSIHKLYNTAKFTINDYTGIMNEYMAFVNGSKFDLQFNNEDDSVFTRPFRIIKNGVAQQKSQNNLNGDIELECLNYNSKELNKVISTAYNSTISNVINDLLKNTSFTKINIQDTLNKLLLICPMISKEKFIMDILLKLSYHTTSYNTPYYCFMDNNNNFNFNSYYDMYSQNSVATLSLNAQGDTLNYYSISDLAIINDNFETSNKCQNIIQCNWDENNNFISQKDSLLNYPSAKSILDGYIIPQIKDDYGIDEYSQCSELYDFMDDEIIIALKADEQRKNLANETLILTVPYNENFVSGKTVDIQLPSTQSNSSEELSVHYSGKYLIESSIINWNGRNAVCTLVCSRRSIKLNNDYKIKSLLLQ